MYDPKAFTIDPAASPALCHASPAAPVCAEPVPHAQALARVPLPHPACYEGYGLSSVFQPVYCLYDGGVVGFEALARTTAESSKGDPVPPARLFDIAAAKGEARLLDATLHGVHIMSFSRLQVRRSDWLFLNVHPESVVDCEQMARLLARTLDRARLSPRRVIVEIVDHGALDHGAVRGLAAACRALGCRIALDNFGGSHSNVHRVWDIAPDIVKLDRRLHARAASCEKMRRTLVRIVALLHEMGCRVLVQDIESEQEALIALDSGADMAQGYYFGFPFSDTMAKDWYRPIHTLWDRLAEERSTLRAVRYRELSPYLHVFARGMKLVGSHIEVGVACADFLALPHAERCYLLDRGGRQHEANVGPNAPPGPGPLCRETDPRGHSVACWVTRPYFEIALDAPQDVHTTGPYPSYAGGNLCITLSAAIKRAGQPMVLCGDIDARVLEDCGAVPARIENGPLSSAR